VVILDARLRSRDTAHAQPKIVLRYVKGRHMIYTRCVFVYIGHPSSHCQPIGIVATLEACLKLHLTNQALICVGATNDLISA